MNDLLEHHIFLNFSIRCQPSMLNIICNLLSSNKLKLTCEVGYDIKATHTCPVEVNKFVRRVSSSHESKCTTKQSLSKARKERLQ